MMGTFLIGAIWAGPTLGHRCYPFLGGANGTSAEETSLLTKKISKQMPVASAMR